MKNVFLRFLDILFSTIFSKITEYIPHLGHYSFLTLNLCQLPITFSTSKFPKLLSTLSFYLIIAHYPDQRLPTEVNRPLGPFCQPVDLLVVTIIGIRREGIWWMRELLTPEVPNMYETTLYNKDLSASLKTLRLCRTLSREDRARWAGAARNVVWKGIKRPCFQTFPISSILLTHNLREPYNGLTHHSLA